MKINGFGGFVDTAGKKSLREFYRESFEAMNESGTKSLILDLRDNGGGEDELGKLLLSYLLDEPFKYYDDLVINARQFSFQKYCNRTEPLPADLLEVQPDGKYRMVKHPNWGMQQPSKPSFHGKVLILINGGSFSTTSEFLSHAHFHKRATFIGEESGGGYYGNTSGPSLRLTLPHTNVQLGVPLMTYYMAVSGYQAKVARSSPRLSRRIHHRRIARGKRQGDGLGLRARSEVVNRAFNIPNPRNGPKAARFDRASIGMNRSR